MCTSQYTHTYKHQTDRSAAVYTNIVTEIKVRHFRSIQGTSQRFQQCSLLIGHSFRNMEGIQFDDSFRNQLILRIGSVGKLILNQIHTHGLLSLFTIVTGSTGCRIVCNHTITDFKPGNPFTDGIYDTACFMPHAERRFIAVSAFIRFHVCTAG